jgi:hypothetical protein
MIPARQLAVRWTIGDVSDFGFEALRLAIWGAWRLFGPDATYAVCVNSVPVQDARARAGELPQGILWHDANNDIPAFIREHLDPGKAEGAGWKFAPVRLYPEHFELSFDNDCILWEMPAAIHEWLERGDARACVTAEDVRPCFGQFEAFCGPEARNGGIRGLPPGFDLEGALKDLLRRNPVTLSSELDEQGLQIAALSYADRTLVVRLDEVSICSPFPPHLPNLGRCGAHFVGLNARSLPWELEGRPAVEYIREHWLRHWDNVYERVAPPS